MRCVNTKNTRLFDADKRITFAANHMIYGNKVANVIPHFLFPKILFGDRANAMRTTFQAWPLPLHRLISFVSHLIACESSATWNEGLIRKMFSLCAIVRFVSVCHARVLFVIITITRCRHGIFQFQSLQLTFFTH